MAITLLKALRRLSAASASDSPGRLLILFRPRNIGDSAERITKRGIARLAFARLARCLASWLDMIGINMAGYLAVAITLARALRRLSAVCSSDSPGSCSILISPSNIGDSAERITGSGLERVASSSLARCLASWLDMIGINIAGYLAIAIMLLMAAWRLALASAGVALVISERSKSNEVAEGMTRRLLKLRRSSLRRALRFERAEMRNICAFRVGLG